jgi:GT2 family glycosyltransferase
MHSASTALNIDVKPNAVAASRRAVQDHLKRIKVDAVVKPHPDIPFWNKILFSLPQELPSVEIIIPTRDKIELLKTCIDSILERTAYSNYHITIIDNGSTEPISHKQFDEWMKHALISIMRDDSPFNFSRLNNRAVYSCSSQYVCLLNNDIEIITPEWLDEMVSVALRPCVGCVGARLWYPDGKLQHGGVVLGIGGVAGHAHKYLRRGEVGYFGRAVSLQAFSCVTGAALLVKKSIYEEVGGLDEGLPVAFNDVDFCLRVMQAGYRNVWTPYAEMYHYESASRGHEDDSEKIKRFHNEIHFMSNRWGDMLLNDPYYSPNLTRVHEDFSYANMSE